MILDPTKRFERALGALPDDKAELAFKALELFLTNDRHPGLHFEKLKGSDYRTIRFNQGDRIVLRRTGRQRYDLVDIGTHDYIYKSYG